MNAMQSRGFTLVDLLGLVAAVACLLGLLIPALGAARGMDEEEVSANNLRVLGMMHRNYANDWDGRQWTTTPDDLTKRLGGGGYPLRYPPQIAPPVSFGHDCSGEEKTTSGGWAIQPFWYAGNCSIGNSRFWYSRPLNVYANGKAYDTMFWAPRDPIRERIGDLLSNPCEWPGVNVFWVPTYSMSVAAQVSPEVYRGPQDGGPQRALDLPFGHRTPNLGQARYPDLKTHMMEHWWLNPPPNPRFIPETEVPWFFNLSDMAENMTLFFDGSVRKLPNIEVLVSNDIVVRGGADPLWADDPACFGSDGYFESFAWEPTMAETLGLVDQVSSHHVFTRDGILGRDTIFSGGN